MGESLFDAPGGWRQLGIAIGMEAHYHHWTPEHPVPKSRESFASAILAVGNTLELIAEQAIESGLGYKEAGEPVTAQAFYDFACHISQ